MLLRKKLKELQNKNNITMKKLFLICSILFICSLASKADTIDFVEFKPDTLIVNFNYNPFHIDESYTIDDLKLLFGSYYTDEPYNSDADFGHRLLCFNTENQIVFKSHGACDSYIFTPHFFISKDKKQLVILCRLGTEYGWGANVFLIEKNNIESIGTLDVVPYNEEEYYSALPITSITNIKHINNRFEFSFNADTLIFNQGGKDEKLISNIKYIYEAGKLTIEDINNK
jgi:hypothetical protein